jgi:hypothetical protein
VHVPDAVAASGTSEGPAGAGKGGKVTAEEAAEEQRRKGVVDDLQKHADSVVIQPGDYQVHVHIIMVCLQMCRRLCLLAACVNGFAML